VMEEAPASAAAVGAGRRREEGAAEHGGDGSRSGKGASPTG
jgi:hypothetical protein